MRKSILQRPVAEAEVMKRNEYEGLICQKEDPRGWRIHKIEKVDKVGEIEKAKKRSLNFILNMMESHYEL